ncbi:hypothetical protein Tco_0024513 [Tanacetum coccineum]
MKILKINRISVDKQFGYGYLKKIVVRHANQKEYIFKEADFPRLHLNNIEDMYLLYAQNKLYHLKGDAHTNLTKLNLTMPQDDNKSLMRADEVYKFRYGTLKKVHEKLVYMLHHFELGYNEGMPMRAWTNKDKKQTSFVMEKIEKTLLTRQILRSLDCYVGGRSIKTDYKLLTRTERLVILSFADISQNQRDLPRDTPIDRVEVLSTAVGDLRDPIWIKLVSTGYRFGLVYELTTQSYGESDASTLEDPTL